MSLVTLPCELVLLVLGYLPFRDACRLRGTCRKFNSVFNEFAKTLLMAYAPFSLEARDNSDYGGQLKRLASRYAAIESVRPYLVATISSGSDNWIYMNGVLCYVYNERFYIWDLHRAASDEIVVSIRGLLNSITDIKEHSGFEPLYYAYDIASCLSIWRHAEHYQIKVVVFNTQTGDVLTTISASFGIVVRNNDRFLYVLGPWSSEIKRFHITQRRWIEKPLEISTWEQGSFESLTTTSTV
ncbi:hypothetical protein MFIFM68171_02771 [Madurella fahalii]|uniref:F-box domain-containing protein n=1 Tax=Madurella fahalii TaxID=1157608 RepID=A0ABQ0G465_9PEZI